VKPGLDVLRGSLPGGGAGASAVSRLLLEEVAEGARGESLRLWQPDAALAFSGIDRSRPGFRAAAAAARAHGFEPFMRLAGGHAAVYAPSLLAFAWTRAEANPRSGIEQRFADIAQRVVAALAALGVDARVGEVPGEFCPGGSSVNARGRVKLMGVGQRVVRGAAYVGGVLQVHEAAAVRDVLVEVYAALELEFEPATFGSVESEIGEATLDDVAAALLAQFERDHVLSPASLGPAFMARAGDAAHRYRIG
jgi:lipoate-protein ligase A